MAKAEADKAIATKRKRGFQVGPKLPKGVYRGHLDKAKRTLIHKAKVKKQYYKALKEAGYADQSAPASASEEAEGVAERVEERPTKRSAPVEQPRKATPVKKEERKKREQLTPAQLDALKAERANERKEWHKKNAKGQPRLGKQSELLLNKIQRSMGA